MRTARGMALLAPAVAFLLGLVQGGWRPEDEITYGYSTFWLCVILVVALVSCAMAVWLWLGYVLGDLLVFDHPPVARFGSPSPSGLVRSSSSSRIWSPTSFGGCGRRSAPGGPPGPGQRRRDAFRRGIARAGWSRRRRGGRVRRRARRSVDPVVPAADPTTVDLGDSQPPAEAIQPVQTHPVVIGVVAGLAAAGLGRGGFVAQDRIIGRRVSRRADGRHAARSARSARSARRWCARR